MKTLSAYLGLLAVPLSACMAEPSLPPLRVSDNHRFLVTESGQPFFWLGDTSWHMFGKSAREEATNQPPVSRYFNMIQTTTRFNFENWRTVAKDYALPPTKPTFDAEVAYEGSLSLRQTEPQDRRIRPWDARRAAYWNVFAGSLGHTYGHRSFIGWIRQGETYRYGAHIPWYESLDAPGAFQMGYLRRLMESRPFLTRVPDQSVIAGDTLTGEEHLQATRDSGGTYAMVYSPSGRPFQVRMDKIAGRKVKAWWFNPRTGEATALGEFANTGEREFTPPTSGEDNDWVLALDDATKNLPAPGLVKDTSGSVQPGTSAERFKSIQVGTRPESVTKGFGGHYYVTVMGDQQPGDAVIKAISMNLPVCCSCRI